jgi:AcrR family transcriptional regulator
MSKAERAIPNTLPATGVPRMRADAWRNRERILVAARDLFVEQGPDVPLDEIARRAGVGIATLYRRFPEREALMRAVVIDALERLADEARRALADEPNGFKALARYMHVALDLRIAAVIPVLLGRLLLEDLELMGLREAAVAPVQAMIDVAHADKTLRAEVTFADISLLIIRLSRPLPGGFSRELSTSLAHRHMDLVINGLQAIAALSSPVLTGPALSLDDLRAIGPGDSQPPTVGSEEERHDA